MKKILLLITIVFFCHFSKGQQLCSFQILNTNCDTLKLKVSVWFSFGAGSTCPVLSGYTNNSNADTLFISLFYDVSGAWPQLGCTATDTIVYALPFSPTLLQLTTNSIFYGDTTFAYSDTTFSFCPVGVDDIFSINSIKIYPNPTTKNIFIDFNKYSFDKFNIEIYSALGQKIKTIKEVNTTTIDFSDLTDGIYFVLITNGHEKRWTKKIIKNAP